MRAGVGARCAPWAAPPDRRGRMRTQRPRPSPTLDACRALRALTRSPWAAMLWNSSSPEAQPCSSAMSRPRSPLGRAGAAQWSGRAVSEKRGTESSKALQLLPSCAQSSFLKRLEGSRDHERG